MLLEGEGKAGLCMSATAEATHPASCYPANKNTLAMVWMWYWLCLDPQYVHQEASVLLSHSIILIIINRFIFQLFYLYLVCIVFVYVLISFIDSFHLFIKKMWWTVFKGVFNKKNALNALKQHSYNYTSTDESSCWLNPLPASLILLLKSKQNKLIYTHSSLHAYSHSYLIYLHIVQKHTHAHRLP